MNTDFWPMRKEIIRKVLNCLTAVILRGLYYKTELRKLYISMVWNTENYILMFKKELCRLNSIYKYLISFMKKTI